MPFNASMRGSFGPQGKFGARRIGSFVTNLQNSSFPHSTNMINSGTRNPWPNGYSVSDPGRTLGFGLHDSSADSASRLPMYLATYVGGTYPDGIFLDEIVVMAHDNHFASYEIQGSNDSSTSGSNIHSTGNWTTIMSGNGSVVLDRQVIHNSTSVLQTVPYKAFRLKINSNELGSGAFASYEWHLNGRYYDGPVYVNPPTGYHQYGFNNNATDSGSNNTAINLFNGSYTNSIVKFGSHARDFNGSNAYGTFNTPLNTNIHTTAMWIYPRGHNPANQGRSYLVDFRNSTYQSTPYGYWLYDYNGTATFGGDVEYTFNWEPKFNTWQHIALVCDGTTAKMYWNGVNIAQTNRVIRTSTTPHLGTYFGGAGSSGQYFTNMVVDNFYWNNVALSDQQISNLYKYGSSF